MKTFYTVFYVHTWILMLFSCEFVSHRYRYQNIYTFLTKLKMKRVKRNKYRNHIDCVDDSSLITSEKSYFS